jgi:hypothetical protein
VKRNSPAFSFVLDQPAIGGGGPGLPYLHVTMELMTVTGTNQINNFQYAPNGELTIIVIDGKMFFPIGSDPDFSVSGNAITWLNEEYSLLPTSNVISIYSY